MAYEHSENLAAVCPWGLTWSGKTVSLDTAKVGPSGEVIFDLSWSIEGIEQDFNGPWVIINPPCRTDDPEGDIILYTRVEIEGSPDELVEDRFTADPAKILTKLVKDHFGP